VYQGQTVAVVIPARNEERQIERVLVTMPDYVDRMVVVDDASTDRTWQIVQAVRERIGPDRVVAIRHDRRRGVGGAICTGYTWARRQKMAMTAVMAGDGQMDPSELEQVIDPIARGLAEYSKGNRLVVDGAWHKIPKSRLIGNAVLSVLTKIASGYWHIADSQAGFTAISLGALQRLDVSRVYRSYGVPNDLLVRLNVVNARVVDVPVTPLYGIGERSRLRIWKVVFTISLLLLRGFVWRLKEKYVIRDFHPLVFFYLSAMGLLAIGAALGGVLLYRNVPLGGHGLPPLQAGWIILDAICVITGFQSLFFAMWFDMDYNRPLSVFLPPAATHDTGEQADGAQKIRGDEEPVAVGVEKT